MANDTIRYAQNVDRLQKIVLLLRSAGIAADIRFPSYIQIGSRLYGAITGSTGHLKMGQSGAIWL
jgi:hypothetical protein